MKITTNRERKQLKNGIHCLVWVSVVKYKHEINQHPKAGNKEIILKMLVNLALCDHINQGLFQFLFYHTSVCRWLHHTAHKVLNCIQNTEKVLISNYYRLQQISNLMLFLKHDTVMIVYLSLPSTVLTCASSLHHLLLSSHSCTFSYLLSAPA